MCKVFKNNHEVKLEQKLHDKNSHQKVELKLNLKKNFNILLQLSQCFMHIFVIKVYILNTVVVVC